MPVGNPRHATLTFIVGGENAEENAGENAGLDPGATMADSPSQLRLHPFLLSKSDLGAIPTTMQ